MTSKLRTRRGSINFEEFKKKLLDKYDLLFKHGHDLEYPTESEIIMLFMSRIVFTEFEIKEMKKLDKRLGD